MFSRLSYHKMKTTINPRVPHGNVTRAHKSQPTIPTTTEPDYVFVYDACTQSFWSQDCYRFGWNLFTVELAANVLLLLPPLSVTVFLLARGRTEKAFRQAFYVQFVAVTVVDAVWTLWVGTVTRTFY